jgi:hypothetical protein
MELPPPPVQPKKCVQSAPPCAWQARVASVLPQVSRGLQSNQCSLGAPVSWVTQACGPVPQSQV